MVLDIGMYVLRRLYRGSAVPYAADLTGDGIADLGLRPDDVVGLGNSPNGFGFLDQSTTYANPIWASSQAPGDFDGDGKADLFFRSDCWYGGCGWIQAVDYAWNGPTANFDAWSNAGPYLSRLSNERRDSRYFVRQLYLDFLNRAPDQGGWDFWQAPIRQCGANLACSGQKRVDVARAFFYSGSLSAAIQSWPPRIVALLLTTVNSFVSVTSASCAASLILAGGITGLGSE